MGQSLPIHSGPVPANVRYAPKATKMLQRRERSDVPKADIHEMICVKKRPPRGGLS
jgi:hypothetical protein